MEVMKQLCAYVESGKWNQGTICVWGCDGRQIMEFKETVMALCREKKWDGVCCWVSEWTDQWMEAYQRENLGSFTAEMVDRDILIMDGAECLSGKNATMTELLWILERRAAKNKMTIVFGDVEPNGWTMVGAKEKACEDKKEYNQEVSQ